MTRTGVCRGRTLPATSSLAAGWEGKAGLLWDALVATGWVVEREGGWRWHDYASVNGLVVQARLRKRRQRDVGRDTPRDAPRDRMRDASRDRVRDDPRDDPRDLLGPQVHRSSGPQVSRSHYDDDDDTRACASGLEPETAAPDGGGEAGERLALGRMQAAYEQAFVIRRWASPENAEEAEALARLAMRRRGVAAVEAAFGRWIEEHRSGAPPQLYRFVKDPGRWIQDGAGATTEEAADVALAERRLWLETLEEERGRAARAEQEAQWQAAGIRF